MTHMPSRILQFKTPLELFSILTCFLSLQRPLGVHILFIYPNSITLKWNLKHSKYIFLGYAANQKRYKCYHLGIKKQMVSQDVTFFKGVVMFSSQKTSFQGKKCWSRKDVFCVSITYSIFFFFFLSWWT